MNAIRLVALSALLGVSTCIPHSIPRRSDELPLDISAPHPADLAPVPPAVLTGCKNHTVQADCSADKCCTWCGPSSPIPSPVPVGWCMPVLPVATSLKCDKLPTSCEKLKVNTTCIEHTECKWLNFSAVDPGVGMCMYDWDSCKAPPATPPPVSHTRNARKHKSATINSHQLDAASSSSAADAFSSSSAPIPPSPPVPKLNCTLATAEECDATKCCQWCGSAFNKTAPGWCMPVLDVPIPMMQCSKGGPSCASLTPAACNVSDTCSWMPFGPPSSTMGVCVFDWKKCSAPAPAV